MAEAETTTHRQLLIGLVRMMEDEALPYYEGAAKRNYLWWHVGAALVLGTSLASALGAGLIDSKMFDVGGKIFLVVVPIIGSGVSGAMHLFQFREKESLRESGRIEIEDILLNARSLLIGSRSEQAFREAFHAVRERYRALEFSQHKGDVALRGDEMLTPYLKDGQTRGRKPLKRKQGTSTP